MSSVIGSEGLDVVLPDGVTANDISVSTDSDGEANVAVSNRISGLKVTATEESTDISGAKLTDSTVNVKGSKGVTSDLDVDNKEFKASTIENNGKGSLDVSVDGTKFNKSTIDAGKKKRADNISFKGEAQIKSSVIKAGKGNDKITFGKEVGFQGKTTIDLGKGGKDSIVIDADSIPDGGKLKITNFTKKDTITVGDETFTYKDVKNGAEIPNIKIKLA
jgi:hypothetical protein